MRTLIATIALFSAACGGNSNSIPACYTNLLNTCAPSGDVTSQTSTDGNTVNLCYANGVKDSATTDPTSFNTHSVIYKADGSICFSADTGGTASVSDGGVVTSAQGSGVYKDASGNTIVTVTSSVTGNDLTATYACGGQTYTVSNNFSSFTGDLGLPNITEGTCTIP